MGESNKGGDGKRADKVAISVSQESGCHSNLFSEECSQSFVDSCFTISPKIIKYVFLIFMSSRLQSVSEKRKLSLSLLLQRSCLGGKYRKSVWVKVVGSVDLAKDPGKDDFREHFHCDPDCTGLHATSYVRLLYMCLCWHFSSLPFSSQQHGATESCNQELDDCFCYLYCKYYLILVFVPGWKDTLRL